MRDRSSNGFERRTDIDDISITQLSLVWNSVTDHFVDRPDLDMSKTHSGHAGTTPTCRLISETRDS